VILLFVVLVPVPCIANRGENGDFFSAIKTSLNWNERITQKQLNNKL